MAIFNKPNQQTDYSSNITTIAAGSHITGKIDIQCELHIDGEVEAEINSTGTIKIGETGVVNSNLNANTLIVAGKLFGNADCEVIELISGGAVEGKLTATTLTIDSASSFQGESIRRNPVDDTKIASFANDHNVDNNADHKADIKADNKVENKVYNKTDNKANNKTD